MFFKVEVPLNTAAEDEIPMEKAETRSQVHATESRDLRRFFHQTGVWQ